MRSFILLNAVIWFALEGYAQDLHIIDSLRLELRASDHPAEIFNEISRAYLIISPEKALDNSELALKEADKSKDEAQIALALKYSALAYQYLGEYDRSIHRIDSAESVFKQLKDQENSLKCVEIKATSYMLQGKYDLAISLLQEVAMKAKEDGFTNIYLTSLMQIGRIQRARGNTKDALENFETALELAIEIHSPNVMGHAYHFIGLVYRDQQMFELATSNYLKALPIFEEEQIITQIPYLLISLGLALQETKNFQEALKYFHEALPYYLQFKDRWGLVELYNYLGSTYFEMNSLDSARIYFVKSLELSQEINKKAGECTAMNKLGEVYIYLQEYEKALEYLERASELNNEIKNDVSLVNILYNTGICYVYSGNLSKGLHSLQQGLVLADSMNLRYEKMILNKEISNAYSTLQNYSMALEHYRVYADLHDSVYQEKAQRNMVEMEQKFQAEKRNIEISQLRLDNAEQELNIRKQKSVRNLFVACFFFAVITGLLLYRSYKRKKKANNEKEALLKEIHHRVKNNLQIISSLLNIQTEYVTDLNVIGAVQESQSRVKAMALIHQLLYQERNLTKINFEEYLKQLASTLASIFQKPGSDIKVVVHASNAYFDIETSIPLGLIINELVSNAFKYAFNGTGEGLIDIDLKSHSGDKYLLVIADNGRGLPPGTDIYSLNTLGLKLVNILTGQIDGRFSYEYAQGARFIIEFADSL
jgi:two-component sensor histidine kinase/uncharacterized protein HemY